MPQPVAQMSGKNTGCAGEKADRPRRVTPLHRNVHRNSGTDWSGKGFNDEDDPNQSSDSNAGDEGCCDALNVFLKKEPQQQKQAEETGNMDD